MPRAISMVTRSGWEILLVIGVLTSPCLAISTGEQLGGGTRLHVATGAQHGSRTRPGDAAGDATGDQGGDDIRLGNTAHDKTPAGGPTPLVIDVVTKGGPTVTTPGSATPYIKCTDNTRPSVLAIDVLGDATRR